jgi:replication factor C large subunit
MEPTVSWTEKYRPTTVAMLLGNEEAVEQFTTWLKGWTGKRKPVKTACLLVGPPGVGKTSLARAAANDLHFRTLEMNASDVRTEKAIERVLGPARASMTLESFARDARRNLILIDEVDGVFGREDRGGLGAVLSIIEKSPVPVVLTANNTENERFLDLMKACLVIQLAEIRPRLLVSLINHILAAERKNVPAKFVKEVARSSHGDIRSAINDVQAAAVGRVGELGSKRTRELDEKQTLTGLFSSNEMGRARRILDETEIPLYTDELLLLVHDLLPYVYTSPEKLTRAYDALSRVDVGYGRIGASRSRGMMPPPFNMPRRDAVPEWSILPFVLNELATIGVLKVDNDIEHAMQIAPRASLRVPERYQYRLWQLDRLCGRAARAVHTSKRTALSSIVPFLVAVFRIDPEKAREIASSLDLEEQDIAFLAAESKAETVPKGEEQILDPAGFKLPYMGKDKFIQLMRAGITYDRRGGRFAVRRLDNLDSVEERISQIISKPVKFKRSEEIVTQDKEGDFTKECYIDSRPVPCAKCEFVDDCPTHTITTMKYCLCDETLADPTSYEKYTASKIPVPVQRAQKRTTRRKKG